jgi:acetyl-CoA carboxylase biotin carboxyl carrier protein
LDFDDIERILELMRRHDLSEFELEREGLKIRVRKTSTGYAPVITPAAIAPTGNVASAPSLAPGPLTAPATPQLPSPVDVDDTPVELAIVKSPIVGTFYRSPEPGAPSFVEVGEYVKKDQVLCIIEAMKLMNEITSEYEGEVSTVYVENGKPVQYGERLFAIKTA